MIKAKPPLNSLLNHLAATHLLCSCSPISLVTYLLFHQSLYLIRFCFILLYCFVFLFAKDTSRLLWTGLSNTMNTSSVAFESCWHRIRSPGLIRISTNISPSCPLSLPSQCGSPPLFEDDYLFCTNDILLTHGGVRYGMVYDRSIMEYYI